MLILEGHTSPVYALAFSPDSFLLASGAKDGGLRLWDPAGGSTDPYPEEQGCRCVTFRSDGALVVGSHQLRVDARSAGRVERHVLMFPPPQTFVTGIAPLDQNLLVLGRSGPTNPSPGTVCLYSGGLNPRKPEFREPHGVRAVASHPPSKAFAWTNGSRRATVRTLDKQDPIQFNLTHNSPAVAFHPDGTLLAVAQQWGATVFDLTRRQERATIKGHKGQVSSVAFSPDGRALATGSWDGTVRLWDPLTGAERQSFQWPTGKVYAMAYAPDGTRMAAAGSSGAVVVWDTE